MNYDPKLAISHVVHDYLSLIAAGTDTQRNNAFPFNHYAERTFLTHYRAFVDFFDPTHTDRRDLHARDFTDSPLSASFLKWSKWSDHIDKHLMHLTVG